MPLWLTCKYLIIKRKIAWPRMGLAQCEWTLRIDVQAHGGNEV